MKVKRQIEEEVDVHPESDLGKALKLLKDLNIDHKVKQINTERLVIEADFKGVCFDIRDFSIEHYPKEGN